MVQPTHDIKDRSFITPNELKHIRLRGHLRAFHNRVYAEDDAYAPMKREHDRQHKEKK